MGRAAIVVEGLGKQYQIGLREAARKNFREALAGMAAAPLERFRRLAGRADEAETFWALRDVSFEVQPGEVVGIIGRNGAGKSTLLKILSQITEPTTGYARIRGRIAALLEVGTGFHPELTGRENVYLNGSILGMSKREIDRKFDEIVDFAGVERFIDTPVKRYSSGMKVRLGFAVAAHLEPEILIVDEVLAVGDAEFQARCLGKMEGAARSGRTVFFVSHNMAAVESLCTRAILLDSGRVHGDGNVSEIMSDYLEPAAAAADVNLKEHSGRRPGSTPVLKRLAIRNADGALTTAVLSGGDVSFEVLLDPPAPVESASVALRITGQHGERVMTLYTRWQAPARLRLECATIARCLVRNLRLAPRRYGIDVVLKQGTRNLDEIVDASAFDVTAVDVFGTGRPPSAAGGYFLAESEWSWAPTESCAY